MQLKGIPRMILTSSPSIPSSLTAIPTEYIILLSTLQSIATLTRRPGCDAKIVCVENAGLFRELLFGCAVFMTAQAAVRKPQGLDLCPEKHQGSGCKYILRVPVIEFGSYLFFSEFLHLCQQSFQFHPCLPQRR